MPSIMNLGQIAPSAKRCIKTTRCPVVVNELRSSVRKHRAPKGALRRACPNGRRHHSMGQKAPSAKRCIKTVRREVLVYGLCNVRKHRAPKGALRQQSGEHECFTDEIVRKHRAPNGALRLMHALNTRNMAEVSESTERHTVH